MLGQFTLRAKLVGLAAVAIVALVVTVVTGSLGIRSGVNGVEEIGRHRLPAVLALQELKEIQVALLSSTYEVALWENDTDAADQFKEIVRDKEKLWQRVAPIWKAYETLAWSDEEGQLWRDFSALWAKFRKDDEALLAFVRSLAENKEAARQRQLFEQYFSLGGQERVSYVAARDALNKVLEINARGVASETESAEQATQLARQLMLWIGGVAILLVAFLCAAIAASILRQMGGDPSAAVAITRRIAEGDLSVPLASDFKDAPNSLLASISDMQQHLRRLIAEVQGSADKLFGNADSLQSDARRVSSNGLEEETAARATAGAVEQISARIAQIGEAADRAHGLSAQAGQYAAEGNALIGDVTSKMARITEAVGESSAQIQELGALSVQISSIVNVIKEVADQTNLLALNAAIEAARAGEQGRGFAVVADEVRKLAERTGASTGEITVMINNIRNGVGSAVASMEMASNSVQEGAVLVEDASRAMDQIRGGADDTSVAVSEITGALQEGKRELLAIEQRMEAIVAMVESNGHSVQAMSRSTGDINDMAQRLAGSIRRFKV